VLKLRAIRENVAYFTLEKENAMIPPTRAESSADDLSREQSEILGMPKRW